MAINKVVIGGEVKIDLTADTVTAESLKSGITAHDKTGAVIEGICTHDVDSSEATANSAEVLEGKTFAARGKVFSGTMPNKGAVNGSIASADSEYAVPMGFHDGSGKVSIDAIERAKIIPSNIKSGVELLGVTGSYGGEEVTAQSKTVIPSFSEQTILPDAEFDYISQVAVAPMPVTEIENSAGGVTLTIGG